MSEVIMQYKGGKIVPLNDEELIDYNKRNADYEDRQDTSTPIGATYQYGLELFTARENRRVAIENELSSIRLLISDKFFEQQDVSGLIAERNLMKSEIISRFPYPAKPDIIDISLLVHEDELKLVEAIESEM